MINTANNQRHNNEVVSLHLVLYKWFLSYYYGEDINIAFYILSHRTQPSMGT